MGNQEHYGMKVFLRNNKKLICFNYLDIYIDEDAEILFQPNIIMLFEVLDFNKVLIKLDLPLPTIKTL